MDRGTIQTSTAQDQREALQVSLQLLKGTVAMLKNICVTQAC
jgi:hypothetical protein